MSMKERTPFVSVIIPTYNRADFIQNSIRSVLQQTYKNLEVIVIDDASLDVTSEKVREINDSRVRYYRMKENVGPSKARNYGASLARGTYLAFHDDDDVWKEYKLEKQIECMKKNSESVMCFGRMAIHEEEYHVSDIPRMNWDWDGVKKSPYEALLIENFIGTPTMVIEKKIFENIGGFCEKIYCKEDWELALRIARKHTLCFVPEVLVDVYHFRHISSTNTNVREHLPAMAYLLEKNLPFCKNENELIMRHLNNLFGMIIHENAVQDEYKLLLKKSFIPKIIKDELVIDLFWDYGINAIRYKRIAQKLFDDDKVLAKWMEERAISDIAIYGMGKLGKTLFKKLRNINVKVVCGIDKEKRMVEQLDVIDIGEFDNYASKVKYIFITPYGQFKEIRELFCKYTHIQCFCIEDLMEYKI